MIADKYTDPKMSKKDLAYIKDILSNDEASSDEELIALFMQELKLSRLQAKVWVRRRYFYLLQIVRIA